MGVVEVAEPNGSFVTGGGYLLMANSAGIYLTDVTNPQVPISLGGNLVVH